MFKLTLFEYKLYRKDRQIISKFRTSMTFRICNTNDIEDEIHFLLKCKTIINNMNTFCI